MDKPWDPHALRRCVFTKTQTHKSRLERLDNVLSAFALGDATSLQGKHILLVDDVMTTGATLEACGLLLLQVSGVRLSMVTIAMAK